jgi:hypothetical protein
MHDDRELIEIEVETLFVHDQNRRLQYHNDPTGPKRIAPRFYLARTKAGNLRRFRYDLPDEIVRQMDELFASEPIAVNLRDRPVHLERFKDILQTHATIQHVGMGLNYRFPDEIKPPTNVVRVTRENAELLRGGFSDTIPELDFVQPCVAVVEDGQAVSLCHSVRLSAQGHEAGVDTLKAYRRRGYATAVVAGWATAVRDLGLIPFYSTAWNNVASQGVTRKLGLVMYGADLSFT